MIAQEGKIYAQIIWNKVHWIFTKNELPEWNNEQCPAVDITELNPKPEIGDDYIDGQFVKSKE